MENVRKKRLIVWLSDLLFDRVKIWPSPQSMPLTTTETPIMAWETVVSLVSRSSIH
jgi:hypothetical protein